MSLQLISYGAMITSFKFSSKTGEVADIALGFDNIEGKWRKWLQIISSLMEEKNSFVLRLFFD